MPQTQPVRVRVGVFELDLRAGELRSLKGAGPAATIVLAQQPLQVLSMLLERAGQLVSREEIQKQLWPNDTVVEFEHSINAAIAKLRKAFGDSANDPSYIETIAKRGYRLIAPTEWLTDSGESSFTSVVASGNGAATRMQPEPVGLAGRVVSHYRVLDIVGGGGMGVVYRAEDLKLGRQVALKFLPEEVGGDARALERFEREARAASALDHPNICSIYEFGEHDGQPFIVMQLLEGETLRERLTSAALQRPGSDGSSEQVFSVDELLDVGGQIAGGLQAAHERGIIHRDIKPANIFLTRRRLVKILDFGVAKLMEAEAGSDPSREPESLRDIDSDEAALTHTGLAMGTVGYMSPEQVRGEKVDARTDIFSFGVVLYEMATGRRAFHGETAVSIHDAILSQAPAPAHELNPAIPSKLEQIIHRAIEKDRERRYQTIGEMSADLQSLLATAPTESEETGVHGSSRWKWLTAAVALLAVAAIAAGLYWRAHRTPKLTDKDTIVIADLDNRTGDPIFDDTLKQTLSAQLSQSPFVNILPNRKIRAALTEMKHPTTETLTVDLAREVCRHTGSKAVLNAVIVDISKKYNLALKIRDCNSDTILAEALEQAEGKDAVLKAVDEAAIALRKQLGEPLSLVQKYAVPTAQATTASIEALQAYGMGHRTERKEGSAAAIPFYKRSVEIDPNFALAYSALAVTYANLNEGQLSEENARKAYALRGRVGEREQLVIEAAYYEKVTGELEKAAEVYERWRKRYPQEMAPCANLSVIYGKLGEFEQNVEVCRAGARLDPNATVVYPNLAVAYGALNRLNEAEDVLKEAQQRNLAGDLAKLVWYQLAFLKGDKAQMEQLAGSGSSATANLLVSAQADTEGWYGRFKSARKLTQQAMDIAMRNDAKETAASYQAAAALREVAAGNRGQARADALAALKLTQNRDMKKMAALVLAQTGDAAAADKLAKELNEAHPLDTLIQRYWLPTIRAAITLQRKDPDQAINILNGTRDIELGDLNSLLPVYVRGEAYLMLDDGEAASAEFQKFIDHYGMVANFPWGALARLGLARAYALEAAHDPAAREKARNAYQNFLTLWKDADPDIPIYKQAKAEYAKLQ
jgi:serine/threonine protein kinase/DNA-binding winged helix-turn-helix (wHTH) protein/predicted Zn-dependent protease